MNVLNLQYQLVVEARGVLFSYCKTISPKDYSDAVENFGRGSIRQTQLHIANTYIHWIGNFALQKSLAFFKEEEVHSIEMMEDAFRNVNLLVKEFLEFFDGRWSESIAHTLPSKGMVTTSPLALLSHVITHEFHHKGQIMSMSRMLGYEPPDTDLIRF